MGSSFLFFISNLHFSFFTLLLPRQGSNLDSSDPESDVLPITPRGNLQSRCCQYTKTGPRRQYDYCLSDLPARACRWCRHKLFPISQASVTECSMIGKAATLILRVFDSYLSEFLILTRRAKARFEQRDWRGGRRDALERMNLYEKVLSQISICGIIRGSPTGH